MSEAVTIDERIALETVDNDLLREVESQWNSDPNNKELELQYALLLAKSHRRDCKKKAIAILSRHLMSRSYTNECLYTISLSYYALHDYEQARNYVEELLRQNTDNSQVSTGCYGSTRFAWLLSSINMPYRTILIY
mmetsp:Transcript_7841/g.11676  ORF Transcript_7841/g.11676 Transcript_7841/m.11676 type:complete len:136 (-) Transcript_7841:346-753(-)